MVLRSERERAIRMLCSVSHQRWKRRTPLRVSVVVSAVMDEREGTNFWCARIFAFAFRSNYEECASFTNFGEKLPTQPR